jgi:hypothetical protein
VRSVQDLSQQSLRELRIQRENALSFDTEYLIKFGKRPRLNLESNSIIG